MATATRDDLRDFTSPSGSRATYPRRAENRCLVSANEREESS
jgi:hypothetical protein